MNKTERVAFLDQSTDKCKKTLKRLDGSHPPDILKKRIVFLCKQNKQSGVQRYQLQYLWSLP